jgi:O6-methylguanine-DNA--protein-cysteine methyltransferase
MTTFDNLQHEQSQREKKQDKPTHDNELNNMVIDLIRYFDNRKALFTSFTVNYDKTETEFTITITGINTK